jgi:ABC-type nitrate/sulfonate/bicarbonate transport system substrate-binding protein
LDAAPLIVARALGYFADEGLTVTLARQVGWANVRDKLVYGHLHASHALVGMPPASLLGRDRFAEPVVALAGLGTGGNAITLSRRIIDAGVRSASALREWAAGRLDRSTPPPTIAHVFGCSMHHYLLRDWLAAGGIDPDRDVRLCVFPPPQMNAHMADGHLDGFCVGEPWNTAAERAGIGRVVATTVEVLPAHPEKVLAVNRRWLAAHGDRASAVVRAVLRGCAFCHDSQNAGQIAELLARPEHLGVADGLIAASLANRRRIAPSFDPAATFPSATHAAWIVDQMVRWGHVAADVDAVGVARRSVETAAWRRAAEALHLPAPADDLPPMRARHGWFDPAKDRQKSPPPCPTAAEPAMAPFQQISLLQDVRTA